MIGEVSLQFHVTHEPNIILGAFTLGLNAKEAPCGAGRSIAAN